MSPLKDVHYRWVPGHATSIWQVFSNSHQPPPFKPLILISHREKTERSRCMDVPPNHRRSRILRRVSLLRQARMVKGRSRRILRESPFRPEEPKGPRYARNVSQPQTHRSNIHAPAFPPYSDHFYSFSVVGKKPEMAVSAPPA